MKMSPELKSRHEEHDKWVREVRDPAQENSEGYRVIEVKGASAEYEIAQLTKGYAIHWWVQFRCGSHHGSSIPWMAMKTREECIQAFTDAVQDHFSQTVQSDAEKKAQHSILEKIDGGLFGFIEPEVDEERTKQDKEIIERIAYQKSLCKKWDS